MEETGAEHNRANLQGTPDVRTSCTRLLAKGPDAYDHVRNNKGINMAAMHISVDSVQVRGDQAQANATFRLKQGGTSMVMVYSLSRHAAGWIVMSEQPADGQFVHPPVDKAHSAPASPTAAAPLGNTVPDFTDLLKSREGNE
jgi:hypothetical protein